MTVPDYELLRCIGRGSYGEVWLARGVTGQYHAVKIVQRKTFEADRHYQREFEGIRACEPVSRGDNGLIDILHVGRDTEAGSFHYVMELADSSAGGDEIDPETYEPRTLLGELNTRERLPISECLALGATLARALAHLHGHGLVHRDVKPGNVVYVNGQPHLADPGLVASLGHASSLVGTLGYLPPEGPGQSAADIYSLGKVLYEAATGMDRQAYPELPSAARGEELGPIFRNFNRILHIACANNPDNRYPSATALAEDLERVANGKPPRLLRSSRSRPMAFGVAAGLTLGGLIWILLAANDPAIPQQDSPVKPRLIAHWPLDGHARDLVGTNHGKINSATPAKDRHGNENGAMHFDGIDDYIRLNKSLPDMTTLTLTAWIQFDGNSTGTLLADDSEMLGNDTFICVTPSFIGLRADRGGALLGHGVVPDYPGTSSWIKWTPKKGQWTHLAWVMEPNRSTLYLNGRKAGVVELSGKQIRYQHDKCTIGGWVQLAKDFRNPFHGKIDGIRIYNHALTNPEIQALSDSN